MQVLFVPSTRELLHHVLYYAAGDVGKARRIGFHSSLKASSLPFFSDGSEGLPALQAQEHTVEDDIIQATEVGPLGRCVWTEGRH